MSTTAVAAPKDQTETVKAGEPSTEPTAVNDPKPSAGASPSGSAKPSVRPATPRSVVRGPLGALEKLRDPSHRRHGGEPTTHAALTTDKAATTGSNPSGGDAPGGDASGGDAEGS